MEAADAEKEGSFLERYDEKGLPAAAEDRLGGGAEAEGSPDAGAETEARPDAGAEAEAKPDAGAEAEASPGIRAEAEARPDAGAETEAKPEAGATPVAAPESSRRCRRCLLGELEGAQSVYESVVRLRRAMPAAERADDPEYERRLAVCRDCPDLDNAVCMQCGCYAEVRALKKSADCPVKRWQAG